MHVKMDNWPCMVTDRLFRMLKEESYTDMELCFSDGSTLPAHSLILHSFTNFFQAKIDNGSFDKIGDGKLRIHMEPKFEKDAVKFLIGFLYTGHAFFNSEEERRDLIQTANGLKISVAANAFLGKKDAEAKAIAKPSTVHSYHKLMQLPSQTMVTKKSAAGSSVVVKPADPKVTRDPLASSNKPAIDSSKLRPSTSNSKESSVDEGQRKWWESYVKRKDSRPIIQSASERENESKTEMIRAILAENPDLFKGSDTVRVKVRVKNANGKNVVKTLTLKSSMAVWQQEPRRVGRPRELPTKREVSEEPASKMLRGDGKWENASDDEDDPSSHEREETKTIVEVSPDIIVKDEPEVFADEVT